MIEENWKVFERFPTYEVSDHGRIRNLKTGHIRNPGITQTGYYVTAFFRNKKNFTMKIHKIVMEVFVGPSNGLVVNHKDGNPLNNHISNLEYVSQRENTSHYFLKKKNCTGASYSASKNRWLSTCTLNGKLHNLGHYKTEKEASEAYKNFLSINNITNKYAKVKPQDQKLAIAEVKR